MRRIGKRLKNQEGSQNWRAYSGYIVDLLAPTNSAIIQTLISNAIEHFKKENIDLIICWMLRNSLNARMCYKILKHNGFINSSSNPLIARMNSPHLSKRFVGDSAKWYVTLGDSDHI